MHKFRLSLALGAFFVVALVLAACGGGGVPGNSVVTVGDQTIKRDTFDHWMRIAAISTERQQNPTATADKVAVPDPPDFKQCIATKRTTAAKPAKGQPEPTDATFKSQCSQEYSGLKNQVLQFLIRATWLDREAAAQKVTVTNADAQKSIDTIKKQQFPKPNDYEKFLRSAGLTNADVVFQQRTQLLEQKITQKVTKGKDNVTDAQIAAYYNAHKSQYASPERRDLRIVLTKTEGKAKQALKALQSGQSWKTVAKTYSIDQASKSNGGKLLGVAKGQQEKALDTAVFGAKPNKLTGPVKTQFGWYVFTVTKVTAAKQQSLADSKAAIKQQLASQGSQSALKKFGDDYRKRWKSETECRKDFVTDDCKNAPKKKAGAATTTAPANGQTQTGSTSTATTP